jgi:hypothetical protein
MDKVGEKEGVWNRESIPQGGFPVEEIKRLSVLSTPLELLCFQRGVPLEWA